MPKFSDYGSLTFEENFGCRLGLFQPSKKSKKKKKNILRYHICSTCLMAILGFLEATNPLGNGSRHVLAVMCCCCCHCCLLKRFVSPQLCLIKLWAFLPDLLGQTELQLARNPFSWDSGWDIQPYIHRDTHTSAAKSSLSCSNIR